MRLIDADALIEAVNNKKVVGRFNTIRLIEDAPTIEPRIEYGSDGQPYRLFISGGHVVPDTLQGWRYEEQPIGGKVVPDTLQGWRYQEAKDELR